TGWRRAVGGGLALGHDIARLVVITGDAESDAAVALARTYPGHALLFAVEREDLAAALETVGRHAQRAILHTLPDPDALAEHEGAVPLPADHVLTGVPPGLAEELEWARRRGSVWTAWVDGAPVSFAYAPWRSARWFDVSVDTL